MKHSKIDYLMRIAKEVATESKDPSSKVGAVIVDSKLRPVSWGYNGFVAGSNDHFMTHERPMKYLTICHAEENAIQFANRDLADCVLVVTHGPCHTCLRLALQKGIREIYYNDSGIVRDRGTEDQKEAIARLILSTGAKVKNLNGNEYLSELNMSEDTLSKIKSMQVSLYDYRE